MKEAQRHAEWLNDDKPYGLTTLQRDALLVIQELSNSGATPSHVELQAELGLSNKSSVHNVLEGLRARGYVDWMHYRSRSLRVLRRIPTPEEVEFVGFFEDEKKAREFTEGAMN
jgi:SOS-response transcriptional repressor LexA